MPIELIFSEHFSQYPDAQSFINTQLYMGRGCSLAVANEGFIVDVYDDVPEEDID